jgi:hypothetical protein
MVSIAMDSVEKSATQWPGVMRYTFIYTRQLRKYEKHVNWDSWSTSLDTKLEHSEKQAVVPTTAMCSKWLMASVRVQSQV